MQYFAQDHPRGRGGFRAARRWRPGLFIDADQETGHFSFGAQAAIRGHGHCSTKCSVLSRARRPTFRCPAWRWAGVTRIDFGRRDQKGAVVFHAPEHPVQPDP